MNLIAEGFRNLGACFTKKNYANFKGCVSRRDFWSMVLAMFLMYLVMYFPCLVLMIAGGGIKVVNVLLCITLLLFLLTFLPLLSSMVKRIRDTGKTMGVVVRFFIIYFASFLLITIDGLLLQSTKALFFIIMAAGVAGFIVSFVYMVQIFIYLCLPTKPKE